MAQRSVRCPQAALSSPAAAKVSPGAKKVEALIYRASGFEKREREDIV